MGRLTPVYVPYTELRPETRAAVEAYGRARFVKMTGHDSYYRLLRDLWGRGTDFIIVEHDVVPADGVLRSMARCDAFTCGSPYPVGNIWGSWLGCTKFTGDLTRKYPDAITEMRVHDWNALDGQLLSYLDRRERDLTHWHWPGARHLNAAYSQDHVYANCGPCGGPLRFDDLAGGPERSRCPRCGQVASYFPGRRPRPLMRARSSTLTKLLYRGRGMYLNGIPARDIETDDAELIAQCLASGLYVKAEPPQRPKPQAAAPVPPAPAPSPAPEAAAPTEEPAAASAAADPVAPSGGDAIVTAPGDGAGKE